MQLLFNQLLNEINRAGRVLFVCHINPDPDTVGSALALGGFVESLGKKADYFCADEIPDNFNFLKNAALFKNDAALFGADYDLVIFCDCSELSRSGVENILDCKRQPWVCIDHHLFKEKIGDWEVRDDRASANCEIVYKFLKFHNHLICPDTATMLLAGILIDTNFLSNSATKSEIVSVVAELCSLGADYRAVVKSFYLNKNPQVLKLWGLSLARLKHNKESGITTTAILSGDGAGCEEAEEAFSGLSNFLSAVLKSDIIMVLEEREGAVKGSLRTIKDNISVAKIAEEYGGGGHAKAAGFLCPGKLVEKEEEWAIERA
ncbi:MAG: DHH family phosphoesterase [bacterium]